MEKSNQNRTDVDSHEIATILVVDDDPFLQKLVCKQLEKMRLKAVVAGSGYEALQYFEKGIHFDLVLMDCQMPGMDGFLLTEKMRALENSPDVPILAMTASIETGEERFIAAGMTGYLSKPFSIQQLAAAISKWIPEANVNIQAPEKNPDRVATKSFDGLPFDSSPADESKELSSIIDVNKLERTFGKEGCLEIVRTFFESHRTILNDIQHARAQEERDRIKALCHRLKGSASMACMRDLSRTSALLEEAGPRADWAEIDCLLGTLGQQLRQANADIITVLGSDA